MNCNNGCIQKGSGGIQNMRLNSMTYLKMIVPSDEIALKGFSNIFLTAEIAVSAAFCNSCPAMGISTVTAVPTT